MGYGRILLVLGFIAALTPASPRPGSAHPLGNFSIARFLADLDRRLPEALTIAEREYKRRPNVFVADTLAWTYYKTGRYADRRGHPCRAGDRSTRGAATLAGC